MSRFDHREWVFLDEFGQLGDVLDLLRSDVDHGVVRTHLKSIKKFVTGREDGGRIVQPLGEQGHEHREAKFDRDFVASV
jgi:hypothetical protein